MNRFNQKVREQALEKEVGTLKLEIEQLKHSLHLHKEALAMETAAKKSFKEKLAREEAARLELMACYQELVQLISKHPTFSYDTLRIGKKQKNFTPILELSDHSLFSDKPKCEKSSDLPMETLSMETPKSKYAKKRSLALFSVTTDSIDTQSSTPSETTGTQSKKPKALRTLKEMLKNTPSPKSSDLDMSKDELSQSRRITYFEKLKQQA